MKPPRPTRLPLLEQDRPGCAKHSIDARDQPLGATAIVFVLVIRQLGLAPSVLSRPEVSCFDSRSKTMMSGLSRPGIWTAIVECFPPAGDSEQRDRICVFRWYDHPTLRVYHSG